MNFYDVIHLIQNVDNMDKVDKVFQERCFNTSFITDEVKEEIKAQAVVIAQMGETKIYNHIKDSYKIKM